MPTIHTPSLTFPKALRSPATLVPVAIIAALAAALALHQIITRWDEINPRRPWIADAAAKVPDEAEAIAILNLSALRNTERRNAFNSWRVAAVANGATDLANWADTGHNIGDEKLTSIKATRITWMSLSAQGGQAIKVDSSPEETTAPFSPADDNSWTKFPTPDGFALLENPTSAGIIVRQAPDKSLAASRDYQQASRAIADPNLIFAFARWRSLPPEIIPPIAHPLSCDTDKWIAAGIDVESQHLITVTIACPHPPGQWGSGPLQTNATSQASWDATIGTTFANDWNSLQSGPANPAVSWIAVRVRTSRPEGSMNMMPHLAGEAWFAYHETPGERKWFISAFLNAVVAEDRLVICNSINQ